MPAVPLTRRLALALAALAGGLSLLGPATASAGTYTVTGACADWELQGHPAADADAGTDGCNFILRNSVQGGAPPAAGGNGARWVYTAPSNTRFTKASALVSLSGNGGAGWEGSLGLDRSTRFACPGDQCGPYLSFDADGAGLAAPSTQLVLQVRCTKTSCPRDQVYAQASLFPRTVSVTIEDLVGPTVAVTGGSIFDGWRSGSASLTYDASDNVGIRNTAPVVNGSVVDQPSRACDYSRKMPCPNGGGRFDVDTRAFADGRHSVAVQGIDSASNGSRASGREALIDNTAPAAPVSLEVDGGEEWRRTNAFAVRFVAPKQDAAPVDGLAYRFCRPGTPLEQTDACGDAQIASKLEPVDEDDPSKGMRVEGLRVPNVGAHQTRFYLHDAAGNADERTATVKTLRYDPDPPQLRFLGQDPADPARVRVQASDAISSVARGEIEGQREGEPLWRQLPLEPSADGFSAVLDDETLPKGTYVLRARAVDQAGNEASSNQRDDSAVATLKLPVRLRSQLQVGSRGKRTCKARGKKRSCRYKLRARVRLSYSSTKRLYGRLRANGQPIAGTAVEVWRQTKLPGAPLQRIDTVQTSKTGRFSVRAGKGPARLLRFRYPGNKHIRGASGDVRMRVRAATTITPNRRRILNGEYLTLRGRVRGGPLPATGKLVELQVFTRRQWRTFAQPRTDAQRRWEYRYRFEQIRRSTRFRFRARLRTEPGFPYETGTSRTQRILVRGGR